MPYVSWNMTKRSGGKLKMEDIVKYAAKQANFVLPKAFGFIKKDPFKNVLFTGRNRAAPANKSPHRQGKQVHALRRE